MQRMTEHIAPRSALLGASLLFVLLFQSCAVEDRPGREGKPSPVEVTFTVPGVGSPSVEGELETRSTTYRNSTAVSNMFVALIPSDQTAADAAVVKSATIDAATSVKLSVDPGTYDVFMGLNWGSAITPASCVRGNFESSPRKSISILTENDGYMRMSGILKNVVIDASTDVVEVDVKRQCCMIQVNKISVDFDGTALEGKSLVIDKIWIENGFKFSYFPCYRFNVNGSSVLANPTNYLFHYNGWSDANHNLSTQCFSESGLNLTIADGASHSTKHYFYVMPNSSTLTTDPATDGSTNTHCTRLVITGAVDGTTYHWHVDVPNMNCNMAYIFSEIHIRNAGGSSPDSPLGLAGVTFTLTITDWETGFSQAMHYQ